MDSSKCFLLCVLKTLRNFSTSDNRSIHEMSFLHVRHSSTQELYPINENMIQNNNNNYVRDSGMNTPGGFQMSSSSSMTNLKMSHSDSRNFLHTQTPGGVSNSMMGTFRNGDQNVNYAIRNNEHSDFDDFENNRGLDPDIHLWKCDQVLRWLVNGGLEELTGADLISYCVVIVNDRVFCVSTLFFVCFRNNVTLELICSAIDFFLNCQRSNYAF